MDFFSFFKNKDRRSGSKQPNTFAKNQAYRAWNAESAALTGGNDPHEETLLKIGPWYKRGGNEDLIRKLLKEKSRSALSDFTEQEIRDMFGAIKHELVDNLLDGVLSWFPFEAGMLLIASELNKAHGELIQVEYRLNPDQIILNYQDGHQIAVGKHSGHPDISMLHFPEDTLAIYCQLAFLNESGFNLSYEKLNDLKRPSVLTPSSSEF